MNKTPGTKFADQLIGYVLFALDDFMETKGHKQAGWQDCDLKILLPKLKYQAKRLKKRYNITEP